MKITYSITKDDLWNFNKYLRSKNRKARFFFPFAIIVISPLIGVLLFYRTESLAISIAASICSISYLLFMGYHYPKKSFLKLIKSEKRLLDEKTLEIGEKGISRITSSKSVFFKWASVTSIQMTDDYLFIFLSELSAIVIPKRIFQSKNDFFQFHNAVSQFHSLTK